MNDNIGILLISFNRPEMTLGAIKNISELKPSKLFFSSDGPRLGNQNDILAIEKCKTYLEKVDWPCQIYTYFGEKNYGPAIWPTKSITWALENVENIIVLEHDVRISREFYESAKILEVKYRDNKKIFAICALNISNGLDPSYEHHYYHTRYFSGWGWLTWRDRWEKYEFSLNKNNRISLLQLLKLNNFNVLIFLYFFINFLKVENKKLETWDFQISNLLFKNDLKVIKFSQNLAENIGDGDEATNTKYLPKLKIFKYYNKKNMDLIQLDSNFEHKWRMGMIIYLLKSMLRRIINV